MPSPSSCFPWVSVLLSHRIFYFQHFWSLNVCRFSPKTSNSLRHQLTVPRFNLILTLPPWHCFHTISDAHLKCLVPRWPTTSVWPGYKSRVSTNRSSGSINLLEQLTKFGSTVTYFYQSMEGCDQNYRWTARWRATQGESGEGSEPRTSAGASVPVELGGVSHPAQPLSRCGCVHHPGHSLNPILLRFL